MNNNLISALIIDDEPLAREELQILLDDSKAFNIKGQASNAIEGIAMIHKLKPQVVFLDIQMPRVSGLEMAGMLEQESAPRIVFVTAYDEYAIKAFEDNAFDYLLKPVEKQRLEKTIERLQQDLTPKSVANFTPEKLTVVPCYFKNCIRLVKIEQLEVAFTDLSGVHVQTAEGQFHTHLTLKILEQKTDLLRCHRQYLINPDAIVEINLLEGGLGEVTTHSGHKVPVSRRYLRELKDRFGFQG
ncbi:two-component system response regulator BtsR [Pelagibaculum spongiae]|uniref:Two-component system response regulator YehT n=1 Tax=Pelagibaculum spongiae TaxID=2080658 RepID=A0A2V1GRC8_9GAMM|nr:two-component system response regulator BtsR [Pelagibaculum spongiae]PVZ66323.1 two-component system response regulator YehT [Pelagibaculum spongiae]